MLLHPLAIINFIKTKSMLYDIEYKNDFEIQNIEYKLPSNSNEPIIHLYKCNNVVMRNLNLDGNMINQPSEISSKKGYTVRNNCISLRHCSNIYILDCVLTNARSGGIVPAFCSDIYIINCICKNNFFDGIAPYKSSNIHIINSTIEDNLYSGVSIDGGSTSININGCIITKNKDWGIWFGEEQKQITENEKESIYKTNKITDNLTGDILHPFLTL